MTDYTLEIEPRDPLVFRDARPFSADPGALAQTLPFPLPSTTTGAVRSHLVRTASGFKGWKDPATNAPDRALAISVKGPLLSRRCGTKHIPFFPAPADALIVIDEKPGTFERQYGADVCGNLETPPDPEDVPKDPVLEIHALRPHEPEAGGIWDMPHGLRPLSIGSEKKPFDAYRYWAQQAIVNWLHSPEPVMPERQQTLGALDTDTRYHVSIDRASGTNVEGALFGTVGLVFERDWTLLARASPPPGETGLTAPERLVPLGGESRFATIRQAPDAWPAPPDAASPAAKGERGVRLLVVTPTVFDHGWLPNSIDLDTREGTLPGLPNGPRVTLASVALPRRVPVSGWDYALGRARSIRYAVPAGTVYFFELTGGATVDQPLLDSLWLHSICDQPEDNATGYGLVVPGIWHVS
jgi:CRISPR-associated protein Cmr3